LNGILENLAEPQTTDSIGSHERSQLDSMYIVGGRQRAPRTLSDGIQDWNGYDRGLITRLDPQTGVWTTCLEYASPSEIIPSEDPAITFQAGFLQGNELYVCTQTELMIYRVPEFERIWYLTHPWFNDVHHLRPSPRGTLLVANAGLEMVMELTTGGQVLHIWNVLGEEPWEHFSQQIDYRRVNTKPHRAHPNYIFCLDQEIWVTRFHQGDAICLDQPEKRIALSTERIHDGVVHEDHAFFTTVNGKVLVANLRTLKLEEVIDLNSMHDANVLLGWCRSLKIDGDKVWVGFSRIRPTKFRENVTWVMRGFKRLLPSHIACYDLCKRECMMEINLEPMGLSAIYSIFPAR
jgi:hypothetical protein